MDKLADIKLKIKQLIIATESIAFDSQCWSTHSLNQKVVEQLVKIPIDFIVE